MATGVFAGTVTEKDRPFQLKRAWIQKAERARKSREAFIRSRGFYNRQLVAPEFKAEMSVGGTLAVPVFCVLYANVTVPPYPLDTLQTKLFDGPYSPMTLSEYYGEVSYGDLTLTGTVYGWKQLLYNDTYYEGGSGCYGMCSSSGVGELIIETVSFYDATIDFGIYDNDGPDNIPNSGDDDGFVDIAMFVHPEHGGPAADNIWTHKGTLTHWTGSPWTSGDPAAGGGFIKVDDYTIHAAIVMGGGSRPIGPFAHELGHALGLPDLYDYDGSSAGIGYWGLMGSGNNNTSTSPAHLCAWSKTELGWANIIEVGSYIEPCVLPNVEFNRTVYRASVMEERWRRMSSCAINGSYSMRCGLVDSEAASRGWPGLEGYGNGWVERVSREFYYDSTGPVTLEYDYAFDAEPGYDYAYGRIEVGGTVSTFATYNGAGSGHETVDLTPYLSGGGASVYELSFVFESDVGYSDEDGEDPSTCGAIVIDGVSVSGGGESYFTDFEVREDGWCADMTQPSEYFLVENRQRLGSEIPIPGTGLLIWHVDQDIATSWMGNTGGPSNQSPQGVALMQADDMMDLNDNTNKGDDGDPYPGTSNNTQFDNGTSPNSLSHSGYATNVLVALTSGDGDPITADMRGSWFLPAHTNHTPDSSGADTTVTIHLYGAGFVEGAAVKLEHGTSAIVASSVEWVGKDYLRAEIHITSQAFGLYDVVVTNPGGGRVVVEDGFTVSNELVGVQEIPTFPREFALRQNYPNPFRAATTIPFDIRAPVKAALRIYDVSGQLIRTLVDRELDAQSYRILWDGRDAFGQPVSSGIYFYKLVAGNFSDVRKLVIAR